MSHVNAVQQENRSMVAPMRVRERASRMKPCMVGLVLVLACLLQGPQLFSQRQFNESKELGVTVGTTYYLGDLNPYAHLGGRLHVGAGGFFRYNINPRISARLHVAQGTVEAWDADSPDAWQQNRNLHFRNTISEYAGLVELNYRNFRFGNAKDRFSAYLVSGIAIFSHMPEAQLDGNWYALQPLGTEGQGTTWGEARGLQPYRTAGVAIPFGCGAKLNLTESLAFSVEWGIRKTWSDYLDDVSTTYADVRVLRSEKGDIAAELADRSLALPDGLETRAGLQRGDPGKSDAYGFVWASLSVRVSRKPTTCTIS